MTEAGILKNKRIYDRMFGQSRGEGFIFEPVLELIINIIEKGGYREILDYDCGNGRFGFYFKQSLKDRRLTGVDISSEALKSCSQIYDRVELMDGLSLPDEKFDFVVMNSVLEHIPLDKWDEFFRVLSSRLKVNGGIFIIFPNKFSPSRIFTKKWADEKDALGHISLASLWYLRKKLRSHGFKKLKSSFFFRIRELPDYVKCPGFLRPAFKALYSVVNVYPCYYLRDSFWVHAKKS